MSGNPQPEDGTVRIATELFEALIRTRIPGVARQVFDCIVRKTYGFNKKEDRIALSQFVEQTGLTKPHVLRATEVLLAMNVITKKGNNAGFAYGVNKRYATWKALPKRVTFPKKVMNVPKKGNASLPKKVPTIDTDTIDTSTKDILPSGERRPAEENGVRAAKKRKGPHPAVDAIMNAMEEQFGRLDDTQERNRRSAWTLFRRAQAERPEASEDQIIRACVTLIRAAAEHPWWGSRIKKVETITKNAQAISASIRKNIEKASIRVA